jgi:hypothetical protein
VPHSTDNRAHGGTGQKDGQKTFKAGRRKHSLGARRVRELKEKRLEGMVAFITEELKRIISQMGKPKSLDTGTIDNVIDRAWDRGSPPVLKEAVAFEIWNALHMLGVEITYTDKCQHLPKIEPGVGKLREAFRALYGA